MIHFAVLCVTAFGFSDVFAISGEPPIIDTTFNELVCKEGISCYIDVTVSGSVEPFFNCSFKKSTPSNQFIQITGTNAMKATINSFQALVNVTLFGSGQIICNISNKDGFTSYTKNVVWYDAQSFIKVRGPQSIHKGDNITIECSTDYDYKNIRWYHKNSKTPTESGLLMEKKNAIKIKYNSKYKFYNSSLVILNITSEYDGVYTCGLIVDHQVVGTPFSVSVCDKTSDKTVKTYGYIEIIAVFSLFIVLFVLLACILPSENAAAAISFELVEKPNDPEIPEILENQKEAENAAAFSASFGLAKLFSSNGSNKLERPGFPDHLVSQLARTKLQRPRFPTEEYRLTGQKEQ